MLVGQLHLHGHRLAVAAQAERDHAAGRRLVDHPAQLRPALDRRAIHAENDVVLLDARLARRSILVDHRHLDALFFFQFRVRPAVRWSRRKCRPRDRNWCRYLRWRTPKAAPANPPTSFCAACEKLRSNGNNTMLVITYLRIVIPS